MNIKKKTNNRFLELDFIRGICILLMILDHFAFFNLNLSIQLFQMNVYQFGFYKFLLYILTNDIRIYSRYLVLIFFFTISGICTQLSKNNFKRGTKLAKLAILITIISIIVSVLFHIDFIVYFGVIHFYAVRLSYIAIPFICIILIAPFAVIRSIFRKNNPMEEPLFGKRKEKIEEKVKENLQ